MSLAEQDIDARIGGQIRALRMARDLTLDELARQSEVSRAMLSRIERGESSPTAQLLVKVCSGLGVTLSALFASAESPRTPLLRRDDQPTWRDPDSHYLRRSVSPTGTGSPVDIVEIEFPPAGSVAFDTQRLPGADQHVWVLDGTLELTLDEDTFQLQTGDCLFTGFGRPVVFRNPTDRPVRYAVIVSHGANKQ
jgi:transcriptional regulator with XRE-family HTH domain